MCGSLERVTDESIFFAPTTNVRALATMAVKIKRQFQLKAIFGNCGAMGATGGGANGCSEICEIEERNITRTETKPNLDVRVTFAAKM